MFTNLYQEVLRAIRRWNEIARVPTEPAPIPCKVRTYEEKQYRPMSIREYRALQQRFKR